MKQKNPINQTDSNCIFCEKVHNDKSDLIYEDVNTAAFLDLFPVETGHILVVPKQHYRTWLETSETDIINTSVIAQKIAKKLQIIFPEIKGYNLIINNEKIANQKIFHFHIHIIPKFAENQGFIAPHTMSEVAKTSLIATRNKIQKLLKNE